MATNTCDCNATSNKLSDLEKAELAIMLSKTVAGFLFKGKVEAVINGFTAFPDMAVKFVDALVKSKNNNFAYTDMAEAVAALVDLVVAGAKLLAVRLFVHFHACVLLIGRLIQDKEIWKFWKKWNRILVSTFQNKKKTMIFPKTGFLV